jgi:hypothetical protein
MADLDKNRHDFLQTLRSFDSKLKPDIVLINESTQDIIIGELTCPMEARMTSWHETKTKKYHDLANRIAEKGFTFRFFAFEVGCRGLVGKSLRKFLTALELPKKIIEGSISVFRSRSNGPMLIPYHSNRLLPLVVADSASSFYDTKIIEETLTDCAITALKCSRKIFLSRSSFNFEPLC